MKQRSKERPSTRRIARELPTLAKRHAGILLAASLVSMGALAACGSDSDTSPAVPPDAGGTLDATGALDAGGTPDAGSPPAGDSAADSAIDPVAAETVRNFISAQTGGIAKLTVPPDDQSIPVPPDDPSRPGRYKTTAAKKYLGKLLFHDPVRTARINVNAQQPLDLPVGTAFGGTVSASDPSVQQVVAATLQTGSCGSCHIGEAAGKAGQVLNFNVGGEGRGYTDANGNFIPRRRPMAILTKVRSQPLFPGDALVDALPTLTDVYSVNGEQNVTTPALFLSQQPAASGHDSRSHQDRPPRRAG